MSSEEEHNSYGNFRNIPLQKYNSKHIFPHLNLEKKSILKKKN